MSAKILKFEAQFRALVNRAWSSEGSTQLASELEATAFRCLGIDLNAEREARLHAASERMNRLDLCCCRACCQGQRRNEGGGR